ncbi:Dihydroorotate dehydrogenase B (NAD(+)), electron transfer subunit [Pseudobythopirellula maris]|uniref:Dihydroorotate dehydrogenase B (NAD(+)), electron transfer subunit n=1 Tax=Pseudobythopirellula maris TaxID=2527991 RepID=A0A5C5ZJ17_9BACT|nr:dihydroorotate dehydrogenase electron transfer subunit [Pseudobythopirellula maris]TWT86811.1 Dihydroorotate dehydrogenase B (NAD(+)), electron transfer subunit [Pseudobythopirellula maris]
MTPPPADACDAHPLSAAHYADRAAFEQAEILENVEIARGTYRTRVAAPEVVGRIFPGQFLMVRLAGQNDPLLGRPFAMYDVVRDASGAAVALDFVWVVGGKLTTALASRQPGDTVEIWGPLGNGFALEAPLDHAIFVAGGIGQTPFLALGKELLGKAGYGRDAARAARVTLCYGVRTSDLLAGESDFRSAGIDLCVASDDGSIGHHGLVTDLLTQTLDEAAAGEKLQVVCCGPEPMMEAVAGLCATRDAACLVSLETPMACGVGVCFSCVARVVDEDGEWDYKRTCVDGPVFDAKRIVW